jgi:hypothetical protein
MVFVAERPISFSSPSNCKLSAAFLRTCQMAHQEGTSILYQENRFSFHRNKERRNPFWSADNKEVGYLDMRHFLAMIGETGRMNLRKMYITLDEATRPAAIELPNSDPRYSTDVNLLECLKMIAQDCSLRILGLSFFGRRILSTVEVRFLEHLCAIQADEFFTNPYSIWAGEKIEPRCKSLLISEITRTEPLYLNDTDGKSKKKRWGSDPSESWWA